MLPAKKINAPRDVHSQEAENVASDLARRENMPRHILFLNKVWYLIHEKIDNEGHYNE